MQVPKQLQKKFKNNAEFIQNAKQNLEKQLATERVLSTPDVPLLEGKLRKLEILQERLKLRLQELQAHLSGMKSRFKWTEEQLQAPIAIELETLSESTILREVVSFKEVLEVAQKETTLFSKEQVQDWIQQGETLQAKAKKTREQFSQAARLINTQEKTICAWLQSIEDLHRQMQEGMEVLSKSLKERQGWKEILSKLKPILAQSREGEFDKEICLDLTATAVRVSEPEDASTEPKTPILTSLTSERTVIDPKSSTPVFEKRFSNLDTRFFPRKSSERSIKTRPETPKQVHWYKKEDSCSESPEGIFSSWSHTLPQESEQEALERGDRERIRIQELEYKESKKRS